MSIQEHLVDIAGDVISGEDVAAYCDVILHSFNVHVDREAFRKGLWKEYPAGDQVNQIRIKSDRIARSLEILAGPGLDNERRAALTSNICEELYDIINYANFAARQVKPETV